MVDNKKYGFILFYRSIRDHWLWTQSDDSPIKRFMDILLEASHKERTIKLGTETIVLQRGKFVHSYGWWAKKWGISKSSVHRFFDKLERDKMAGRETVRLAGRTYVRVTVVNYDHYQSMVDLSGTRNGTRSGTFSKELKRINNIESGFDNFWERYHHLSELPKTDKTPTLKHWKKLNRQEKIDAYQCIEGYVGMVVDRWRNKRYCKKARTYLSDREWESVVETKKKKVVI